MSTSAAQAEAFYREAIAGSYVWSVRDEGGFPAPLRPDGVRAMPFWSQRSRAELIIAKVPAFVGFDVVPIPIADWRNRWLPGLTEDGVLVGLNWSGESATGYDVEATTVEESLQQRTVT